MKPFRFARQHLPAGVVAFLFSLFAATVIRNSQRIAHWSLPPERSPAAATGWELRWEEPGTEPPPWEPANADALARPNDPKRTLAYRFRIPTPLPPDSVMYIRCLSDSFVLTLPEGEERYRFGTFDGRSDNGGFAHHVIPLKPEDAGRTFELRARSGLRHVGICSNPRIQPQGDLYRQLLRSSVPTLLLGPVYVFLGGFALFVWLFAFRRPTYRAFGIFCLCAGGYTLIRNNLRFFFVENIDLLTSLDLGILFLLAPSLAAFLFHAMERHRLLAALRNMLILFATVALASALAGVPLARFVTPFHVCALSSGAIAIIVVALHAFRKNTNARIMSAAMLLVLAAAVTDILATQYLPSWPHFLLDYALFISTSLMSLILVREFRQLQRENGAYASSLAARNRELEAARDEIQQRFVDLVSLAAQTSDRLNSPLTVLENTIPKIGRKPPEGEVDDNGKAPEDKNSERVMEYLGAAVAEIRRLSGELAHVREKLPKVEATKAITAGSVHLRPKKDAQN